VINLNSNYLHAESKGTAPDRRSLYSASHRRRAKWGTWVRAGACVESECYSSKRDVGAFDRARRSGSLNIALMVTILEMVTEPQPISLAWASRTAWAGIMRVRRGVVAWFRNAGTRTLNRCRALGTRTSSRNIQAQPTAGLKAVFAGSTSCRRPVQETADNLASNLIHPLWWGQQPIGQKGAKQGGSTGLEERPKIFGGGDLAAGSWSGCWGGAPLVPLACHGERNVQRA